MLMQPVPLYPLFGGFTVGILAEWFDISLHVSMVITLNSNMFQSENLKLFIVLLVAVQLELLILCFEKKHQAIANTLNIHVLPNWFLRFSYFLTILCPIIVTVWYHTERSGKEEQWDFIGKVERCLINVVNVYNWYLHNSPQYQDNFRSLSHFDIYMNTPSFILMLVLSICGGLILMTFFLLFIIDRFRMMIHLKLKISSVTYRKHKEAIQNLMIQFATSSFCVAPPCCFAFVVLLELDQAQLLTELCICWFATHSSVNTISLLIFFSPYRNFILKQLRALVYQWQELRNEMTLFQKTDDWQADASWKVFKHSGTFHIIPPSRSFGFEFCGSFMIM